jgi:hypothetical protein
MRISAAARFSGKAENTIRLWAIRHGIGRKIGGVWHISRVALRIFMDGDMTALDAYHSGDRNNPLVRPYFERAGVSPTECRGDGSIAAGTGRAVVASSSYAGGAGSRCSRG